MKTEMMRVPPPPDGPSGGSGGGGIQDRVHPLPPHPAGLAGSPAWIGGTGGHRLVTPPPPPPSPPALPSQILLGSIDCHPYSVTSGVVWLYISNSMDMCSPSGGDGTHNRKPPCLTSTAAHDIRVHVKSMVLEGSPFQGNTTRRGIFRRWKAPPSR